MRKILQQRVDLLFGIQRNNKYSINLKQKKMCPTDPKPKPPPPPPDEEGKSIKPKKGKK